jgi:phosphatidylglycerol:prolipoprotein diacylglycerol transferase
MISPAVMIGQILGRYGNFMNAEAYGAETSLPWRMGIRRTFDGIPYGNTIYVHPTFFYESLWNLIGFILINLIYSKKKFDGQIFYMYFAWYGFGRMFIELLRSDSLYISSYHVWWTKISFIVGFAFFVVFTALLVINFVKIKKNSKEKEEI